MEMLSLPLINDNDDNTMSGTNDKTNNGPHHPLWPIEAASRIRVKIETKDTSSSSTTNQKKKQKQQYCRLFYNSRTGTIDLISYNNDTCNNNSNTDDDNLKDATAKKNDDYKSYLATLDALNSNHAMNDNKTITTSKSTSTTTTKSTTTILVADSFHPNNIIGAHLSLDYNIHNPNTFCGMPSYAVAKYVIYNYHTPTTTAVRGKKNGKRSANHKYYTLDPSCCFDFGDARCVVRAIRALAKLDVHYYLQDRTPTNDNHDNNDDDNNNDIGGNDGDAMNGNADNTSDTTTTTTITQEKPAKYLVILNPFSGGGGPNSPTGALKIYETLMKPMLEQSGVEHHVLVTRRAGHANERMGWKDCGNNSGGGGNNIGGGGGGGDNFNNDDSNSSTNQLENADPETNDISTYNAIIAMGGDGILYEIFQGIHSREDETQIMKRMKFGIVGCGTSNGLAKSILHWGSGGENSYYGALESIFRICKGRTSTLDIATYELLPKGSTDVTATTTTTATTLVSAETQKIKTYTSFLSFSWGLIADCDLESECLRWLGPLRSDIWAVYRGVLFPRKYRARFSYLPPSSEGAADAQSDMMPKLGESLPEGWVTMEEDFTVFWVCQTSHAAYNMYNCPMAKMNDGLFHILVVRASCSRIRLIQMLLKLESGNHINCKGLEVIDCVAYRFEPLSDNSYNDLDGELIEDGPIQAHFMPKGAQFFA